MDLIFWIDAPYQQIMPLLECLVARKGNRVSQVIEKLLNNEKIKMGWKYLLSNVLI